MLQHFTIKRQKKYNHALKILHSYLIHTLTHIHTMRIECIVYIENEI